MGSSGVHVDRDAARDGGPRRAPFVLLVLGLIGAGLCALLVLNTVAAADEVRQRSLADTNADTQNQAQQLQLQIADKQAPAALASAARQLGMVPNPNPAFIVVRPDGKVVVMGLPAQAKAVLAPKPTLSSPKPTAKSTAGRTQPPKTPGPATVTLPGGPR
jgi:hypothetical protein